MTGLIEQDAPEKPPLDAEGDQVPDIIVDGVSKYFDDFAAIDSLTLHAGRGEVFGLVGPSGSGKTTLVRILVGLLRPSSGFVSVFGVDPLEFGPQDRSQIGYMPQQFSLYPTLTVWENARFMAGLYGLGWRRRSQRIREVLSFLEIWDARKRLARDLSGGMQRRLALAGALLHEPKLLVVDEPTAGLDPVLRLRIWDMLRSIRDQGTTVFLTTQYIDEAEKCDRVAVLRDGKLVAVDSPLGLRSEADLPDALDLEVKGLSQKIVDSLWQIEGVRGLHWDGDRLLSIRTNDANRIEPAVQQTLATTGCRVEGTHIREASFEEVFMRLVDRAA